jgi:hypothetical protein
MCIASTRIMQYAHSKENCIPAPKEENQKIAANQARKE